MGEEKLHLGPNGTQLDGINAEDVPWWTSKRFILSIICFFGFANLYSQRVNLSMAMVCMVNHTATDAHLHQDPVANEYVHYNNWNGSETLYVTTEQSPTKETCPVPDKAENGTIGQSEQGTFVWSKAIQGLLLGSFFWGYLFPQIPGGWLSERFGAKKVVAFGMFPVAILTLLTPVSAYSSPWLLLVVRILVGVGEAVLYPAAQALFSHWAAPWERSRLIGISYAGGQFGNAIAFPVSGLLCEYGFGGGWPSIFYVLGGCGLLWCIIWIIFVHDTPAESPRITDIEKKYIEQSLGVGENRTKNRRPPWKAIFTSRPVWAIIIAHTCGNWGAYLILTSAPAYMKEVLKFDIKKNGLFTMLPYLSFWLCINIGGTIADLLIVKKILSVVWTRKLLDTIGLVMPGVLMVIMGYMSCNQQAAAVALLVLAMGFSGFQFAAHFVNHGDIAPKFAGTLFGVSNVAATIPGILAPYIVGAVTTEKTREQWLIVFYISGGIHIFGAIVYLLFAEGVIQSWAKDPEGPFVDDDNTNALLDRDKKKDGIELIKVSGEDVRNDSNPLVDKVAV